MLKCLYAQVHYCRSASPAQALANVTFTFPHGLSNRCQSQILTAKRAFATTIPNQCQEKLPSRPTRPEDIDAPGVEHQSASAAYLGHARAVRFRRVDFGKSFLMGEIPCAIDAPDGSGKHGALQLDGVEVPSLHREETGSL